MVVSLSFCTLKKIKGRTFRLFFVLVLCVIALIFYLLLSRADTCPHNDHEHSISSSELGHVNSLVRKQLVKLDVLIAQRDGILKEIQKYLKNIDPLRRKSRSLSDMVLKHREELEQFRLRKKIPNTCPRLPPLRLPKDISMSKLSSSFKTDSKLRINCKLSSCFKLQKCPHGGSFLAHVYKLQNVRVMSNTTQELYTMLESLQSLTDVSAAPCIYIVIIDTSLQNSPKAIENFLHKLKYWQGEGHNHIIINFAKGDLLATVDTGRAMIAQTTFGPRAPYRREFDIVIPPLMSLRKSGPVWENSAPQLPANRKYMLSFVGNYGKPKKGSRNENTISVDDLKQLSSEAKDMLIQLSCQVDEEFSNYNYWQLCWSHNERAKVLKASTFALIIQFGDDQTMTLVRLMEALQYGSIPVIISDNVLLPLSDIIDWHRATITLHEAQFPQLNFVLRTISVNDLFHIRRQGRFLWETYFSTTKTVLQSIMAAIQTRLLMSGILGRDTKLPSVFDDAGREPVFNFSNAELTSPRFSRNFTANTVYGRQRWNTYPGALLFYPSSPFVPVLPSSAAFLNSLDHIQPIGKGSGGDGREFKKALGGNHPYEQFTIVMLTYKREKLLVKSLARFAQLQYLSKVVIVWNSPRDPSSALTWPNIGVPIKVSEPTLSLGGQKCPHTKNKRRHPFVVFGERG